MDRLQTAQPVTDTPQAAFSVDKLNADIAAKQEMADAFAERYDNAARLSTHRANGRLLITAVADTSLLRCP